MNHIQREIWSLRLSRSISSTSSSCFQFIRPVFVSLICHFIQLTTRWWSIDSLYLSFQNRHLRPHYMDQEPEWIHESPLLVMWIFGFFYKTWHYIFMKVCGWCRSKTYFMWKSQRHLNWMTTDQPQWAFIILLFVLSWAVHRSRTQIQPPSHSQGQINTSKQCHNKANCVFFCPKNAQNVSSSLQSNLWFVQATTAHSFQILHIMHWWVQSYWWLGKQNYVQIFNSALLLTVLFGKN